MTEDSKLVSEDKNIKSHPIDDNLVRAVATGEGTVVVTPDILRELGIAIEKRTKEVDENHPKLIAAVDEETRIAITAQVFEAIVDHAHEGGTYRYLIYERLKFTPAAYGPLYNSGGMTISNEFDLSDDAGIDSKWLPIDTAPKDGTHVDLWYTPAHGCVSRPHRVSDCWYYDGKWWEYAEHEDGGDGYNRREVLGATHWMKIPDPPEV